MSDEERKLPCRPLVCAVDAAGPSQAMKAPSRSGLQAARSFPFCCAQIRFITCSRHRLLGLYNAVYCRSNKTRDPKIVWDLSLQALALQSEKFGSQYAMRHVNTCCDSDHIRVWKINHCFTVTRPLPCTATSHRQIYPH